MKHSMFTKGLRFLVITSAVMVAATLVAATAPAPTLTLEAAWRGNGATWLINGVGELYELRPGQPIRRALLLTENGRARRWSRTPTSLANWKNQWFVTDGSNTMARFDAKGAFTGAISLPVRAANVIAAGPQLWIVNSAAPSPAEQLYSSTDGRTFKPYRREGERFATPMDNVLIIGGSGAGELWASRVVGPPVISRLAPGPAKNVPVAYSRSKFRSTMESVTGLVDDVTIYSLPVRDLLPLDRSGVVVLRNREDVEDQSGKVIPFLGRRADRYDAGGKHTGTAVFPDSVHWIASVDQSGVTGVSRAGKVLTAKWGQQVPGTVLKR